MKKYQYVIIILCVLLLRMVSGKKNQVSKNMVVMKYKENNVE